MLLVLFSATCFGAETISLWDGTSVQVDSVVKVDQTGATVKYGGETILLEWATMTTMEAMRVWENYIDQANAVAWFELGLFALKAGYKPKARDYFAKATGLDPGLTPRIPPLDDPKAEKTEILALIEKAAKAEAQKKFTEAVAILEGVLAWPNKTVLEEALRDTDFLNTALLQDHVRRLRQKHLEAQGFTRMGLKWVKDDRKIREIDQQERDNSDIADEKDNAAHSGWDMCWQKPGRWFNLRTNSRKWYMMRFTNRLDILLDEYTNVYGSRRLVDKKPAFNIYASRTEYANAARAELPGASELGGFFSKGTAHLFIENENDDLAFEDLSVMSLNYLASAAYLHSLSDNVPAWLEAGVGLYFQDCQWYSARKVEVGKAPNRYALRQFQAGLAEGQVFDPERIFKAEGNLSSFDRYAAWAIVCYCLDGNATMKSAFQKAMKSFGEDANAFDGVYSKAKSLKDDVPKHFAGAEPLMLVFEIPPYPMF
mgnify:CR=1 FL=1